MKHIAQQKSFWGTLLSVSLIGVLIGVLFWVLNADALLRIVSVILGVITVISSIPDLIAGIAALPSRHGTVSFLIALVTAVLGFVLIFSHRTLILILLGVFLVVLPVLQLLLSKDRKRILRRTLPQILLGILLIVVGPAAILNVLFDIAGIVVLVLTAVYIVGMLLSLRRSQKKTGGRVFVDADSDGTIDAVYIDTTGDGRADTSVPYQNRRR
jgi:MFS family permease